MLNPQEEAKFKELKDKCRELKVSPPPDIMIGLQVHDKNGVLTFDDIQRGHSWTRNFWNVVFRDIARGTLGITNFGAGYVSIKGVSGSVFNAYDASISVFAVGTLGDATKGIVVGTGDTAFDIDQYGLAAKIAHGSTTGTFAYAAQNATTQAYTAGSKTWKTTLVRIFNNNSGGSITVKETGINGSNSNQVSGWLVERSVLDPTVAVANGAQLTVTYEISMDFSAID